MSNAELNQDFFELGDKTSLVCADPATTEIVRNSLKDLGYKSTLQIPKMGDRTDTIHAIRLHRHPRKLCGKLLQTNAVLQYLAPLPMTQRRDLLRLPDWRFVQNAGRDAGIRAKRSRGGESVWICRT